MKLNTNYLYLLLLPLSILGFYRIYNPPIQQNQEVRLEEQRPTIRLDSLAKLNINVTLWVESKKDFESLYDVELEIVSFYPESFVGNFSSEFSWEVEKYWMNWEVSSMSIFTDYRLDTDRFVVIGYYTLDGQRIHFYGDVYKYPAN